MCSQALVTHQAITYDQLVDYALGVVDPVTGRQITMHLADGCPQCLVELERLELILSATRPGVPTAPPSWVLHRAKQLFVQHEVEAVPRRDRLAAFLIETRTIVGAAVLVTLLAVVLGGAYVWRRIPTARTATLTVLAGQVETQKTADADWEPVGSAVEVGAGMALRTSHAGAGELAFPDQSGLELGGDSLIRIGALHTLTGVGPQVVQMEHFQGRGRYRVSPGRPGGGFTVGTPVARIQGRDTKYDLTVEQDGTTTVQVLDGAVTVSAGNQSVTVSAGEVLVISPTVPEKPLQPSPFAVTVVPTPEPSETATERAAAAVPARATETFIPDVTPTVTATGQPVPPRRPSTTPTSTRTPTSTATATATRTPTSTATVVPTDTPSATPLPTSTATATPVPPTRVRPSATPLPPSPTPAPPTDTPIPPTPVPPTDTPIPPTPTLPPVITKPKPTAEPTSPPQPTSPPEPTSPAQPTSPAGG